MPRWFTRNENWDFGGKPSPDEAESGEPKRRKRRLATTFVFTALFFAGASLAAVAGDRFSASIAEDNSAAIESTTTTTSDDSSAPSADAAPAADESAAAAPASDSSADASSPAADAADSTAGTSDSGFTQVSSGNAASSSPSTSSPSHGWVATPSSSSSKARGTHRASGRRADAQSQWVQLRKVLLPKTKPAPKPEIEGPASAATIWLNSPLPDPTPPAVRLSPKFAANLKQAAKSGGVDWAVMLGILRARGARGHIPADHVTLNRLATRLDSFGPSRGDWSRIVAYSGDSRFADKAAALARYNRAVGIDALVNGLEASKAAIASKVLGDPSISIYQGGRSDIVSNKID